MRKKGIFITIEGVDASGKSSLLPLIINYLKEETKKEVFSTREPGGTILGEAVRNLLFDFHEEMDIKTELLLFLATRAALQKTIVEELKSGKIVISDRYQDSTFVYQGSLGGLDLSELLLLNSFATSGLDPDLTLVILIPHEESERRLLGRSDNGKYDGLCKEKFNKIYNGYVELQRNFPERIVLINGNQPQEQVFNDIKKVLKEKL